MEWRLHLALIAQGIGPGDQVIVLANTYVATWLAVAYTGAELVLDRTHGQSLTECVRIQRAISDRTKAVIPVHLYGMPCPMLENYGPGPAKPDCYRRQCAGFTVPVWAIK